MSDRPLLAPDQVIAPARAAQAQFHRSTVDAVAGAVSTHDVVVIGMGWNPHVRWARKVLDAQSIAHHDLDFGNYLTGWKKRLAIKLWSGWPTFPQVFVKGTLIGGHTDLRRALEDGTIKALLGTDA